MFKSTQCSLCGKDGASLFCSNSKTNKKCQMAYHFPCAYASKKVTFDRSTDIYCETCTSKMPDSHPGLPIEFRDYPKRRVIIVKNVKPQCTNAFNSQVRKLGGQPTTQGQAAPEEASVQAQDEGTKLQS